MWKLFKSINGLYLAIEYSQYRLNLIQNLFKPQLEGLVSDNKEVFVMALHIICKPLLSTKEHIQLRKDC